MSSLSGPVTRTYRVHSNARVYSVQVREEGARRSVGRAPPRWLPPRVVRSAAAAAPASAHTYRGAVLPGAPARIARLQLFHNTVSGDRNLSIDGAEVTGTAGRTTVFQSAAPLMFTIDGRDGNVTIIPRGATIGEQQRCTLAA